MRAGHRETKSAVGINNIREGPIKSNRKLELHKIPGTEGLGDEASPADADRINVVYRRLPILAIEEQGRLADIAIIRATAAKSKSHSNGVDMITVNIKKIGPILRRTVSDWREFITSPIFPSSLAISLLYLTVLSFDGTMISWLRSHQFSDAFVAGMRGVCVVTGLMGTVAMPWMERRIGVNLTSFHDRFEVVTLLPVLLSFFVGAAKEGQRSSPWNAAMLFTGMALSRIGLWAFDLCQTKEIQITLQDHPRRNSIMALQYSLQNLLDMTKYVLTIVLSQPRQFKWAALVSYISVGLGAISYLAYSRKERGHLVHLDWTERLIRKKN
ncbi:solute carrier family 40 (iron-regulated transporter), member 1, partial [Phenoliferia sp. Uapishka_3]